MIGVRLETTAFATILLLSGCAATPMKADVRTRLIADQVRLVEARPTCCGRWEDLDYSRTLTADGFEVDLGSAGVQIRNFGEYRAPVVGISLPPGATGQMIEIFSLSVPGGMIRFDDQLFVRPDVLLLDGNHRVVEEVRNPVMCFGRHGRNSGGVWTRIPIRDPSARYAVVSPSVAVPMQLVDTRDPSIKAPGLQAIADARGQTYLTTVGVGYLGRVAIRSMDPDARMPGRCVSASD